MWSVSIQGCSDGHGWTLGQDETAYGLDASSSMPRVSAYSQLSRSFSFAVDKLAFGLQSFDETQSFFQKAFIIKLYSFLAVVAFRIHAFLWHSVLCTQFLSLHDTCKPDWCFLSHQTMNKIDADRRSKVR